jgi:hypothetical protein
MRLVSRSAHYPTCPLCRESVLLLETRSCEGCRTNYHQACLEEFTGCSTLGCASTTYVEADLGSPQLSPPLRTALEPGSIRVSERVSPTAAARWAPVRTFLGEAWQRVTSVTSRLRAIDGVAALLLFSALVGVALVACQGLRSLVGLTFSELAAIALALAALSGVVFAAHAVSSRNE